MRKQSGFSLIELMIVVAVIGVLTAIALPAYQNYTKKAELGAALASINAVKTNVEEYMLNFNKFPTTGTAADPDSNTVTHPQLGLPADGFKYGDWAAAPGDADDGTGSLTITFGNTSAVGDGSTLSLERDDKGRWTCIVAIVGVAADAKVSYLPNNCKLGSAG
ncbi:MAG: pilin [Vibrionaceae bacterium]